MQLVKFTLVAPSGSGGAFFSELLDGQSCDAISENIRNKKTNEYAGSPNLRQYWNYECHDEIDVWPSCDENSILYSKRFSPVPFYETRYYSPVTYLIDITGNEKYLKDIVFIKKVCGSPITVNGSICSIDFFQKFNIEFDELVTEDNIKLVQTKLNNTVNSISDLIDPKSHTIMKFHIENKCSPVIRKDDVVKFIKYDYKQFYDKDHGFASIWDGTGVDKVKIIKLSDLINGVETDTPLDDYKKDIEEYFNRNNDIIDNFFTDLGL